MEVALCDHGRVTVYARVEDKADPETIVTSGCGGTGRIARTMLEADFPPATMSEVTFEEIAGLIRGSLGNSTLQQQTHCVHACGYLARGRFLGCFEDIGRHNAVDKVIGAILLGRFPSGGAIYTTGRLTSDMVLKCARIGIPVVISRTAPSSLGLEIARRADLTLAAYARARTAQRVSCSLADRPKTASATHPPMIHPEPKYLRQSMVMPSDCSARPACRRMSSITARTTSRGEPA